MSVWPNKSDADEEDETVLVPFIALGGGVYSWLRVWKKLGSWVKSPGILIFKLVPVTDVKIEIIGTIRIKTRLNLVMNLSIKFCFSNSINKKMQI